MYRPAEATQMTTPLMLQTPTSERVGGVLKKTYTDAEGIVFANFKTYGGTEREVNGAYVVEDTANIVCWWRPDLTAGCRLKRLTDGAIFEIIGEPENIELRNMFFKFKVRRVKGGA